MAHNTFTRFVKGDDDLTGLVAYSLYKQDKISWVANRTTANNGIPPNTQEIEDFFITPYDNAQIVRLRKEANQRLNALANAMLLEELLQTKQEIQNDETVVTVRNLLDTTSKSIDSSVAASLQTVEALVKSNESLINGTKQAIEQSLNSHGDTWQQTLKDNGSIKNNVTAGIIQTFVLGALSLLIWLYSLMPGNAISEAGKFVKDLASPTAAKLTDQAAK